MRRRFNRGRYYERMLAGELAIRMKQSHPSRTKADEPFCTWTQEVFYLDATNQEVARIHQYLRPDGTLGASGLPDPKQIFEDGLMYRLRKPAKNRYKVIAFSISDWRDRICWWVGIEVD